MWSVEARESQSSIACRNAHSGGIAKEIIVSKVLGVILGRHYEVTSVKFLKEVEMFEKMLTECRNQCLIIKNDFGAR